MATNQAFNPGNRYDAPTISRPHPGAAHAIGGAAMGSPQEHMYEDTPSPSPELVYAAASSRCLLQGQAEHIAHDAPPILSAEQVSRQLGEYIGGLELAAVIELPGRAAYVAKYAQAPEPVYCFRRRQRAPVGRGAQMQNAYYFMGREKLHELVDAARRGLSLDYTMADVPVLTQGGNEMLVIGRHAWLPDVGLETDLLQTDKELAERYAKTSAKQAAAHITPQGGLQIADMRSYNGTVVCTGRPGRMHPMPVAARPAR